VVPSPQQGVDNGRRHGLHCCSLRLEEVLVDDMRRRGKLQQEQQRRQGNASNQRSHCSHSLQALEQLGKDAGSGSERAAIYRAVRAGAGVLSFFRQALLRSELGPLGFGELVDRVPVRSVV
jgi:hypothetical protein